MKFAKSSSSSTRLIGDSTKGVVGDQEKPLLVNTWKGTSQAVDRRFFSYICMYVHTHSYFYNSSCMNNELLGNKTG